MAVDTKFAKLAVLICPARLAVDTKFARLAVLICPARLAVDTKFARLAVETNPPITGNVERYPDEPRPITVLVN